MLANSSSIVMHAPKKNLDKIQLCSKLSVQYLIFIVDSQKTTEFLTASRFLWQLVSYFQG